MAESERLEKAGIEREYLQDLEEWLASYDRVFVVPEENGTAGSLVSSILRAGVGKTGGRKVLVLSAVPIETSPEFTYKQITAQEQKQLSQLYRMYEFSDHFSVIAEESAYGSLFNLVENGLLNMEEAAEALFTYG